MPDLGWGEVLIIALVFMLLFGAKKLPDTARAIGRSMRIFKAEASKLDDDDSEAPGQGPSAALSLEEQARRLEEQAARLRASAAGTDEH
ncbi:Sec-independent protein translocase subunit TatA [Actinomadura sp. ATCC 31491]|uniref:Sec-independent protein translocase protein TatA n=1 Tax=Actinomadura luzonensis TaxID=2805427 RepID=A0ABT0G8Q8_9ACTN|nr:Sec-independent protein translocase subunit TatA [Actinomadura luzonensis]MCK2220971.1 Sec-independent protein translocase subunit TatA [Actinomadura luzonensis]